MKPLLAHVYEPHRVTYPCYVQPKLNGIRALYQNGRFQSRDEIPFAPELLRHLSEPLQSIFGPEVILDGELYVHGWPLQRILGAVTPVRKEEKGDTKSVEYHVFDVVNFNETFNNRRKLTNQLLSLCHPQIKEVETRFINYEAVANEFYSRWVSQGYEGMMYRLGPCPYTRPLEPAFPDQWKANPKSKSLSDKNNRCWHLLKRKDWQDDEFTCVGVEEGEGKYKDAVGALRCAVDSSSFTVSGGLTDADRLKFWEYSMLVVGKQIKVKYLCLSEDGIPLNPTILAIL